MARELSDLLGQDHSAATAVDTDVVGARRTQLCAQVGEVLDVTTLVRRHRDAVGVLLEGRPDDLGDAAVMPEVDHLGALRLQDPAHDRDGGIVAVEETRGRDEAHGTLGHAAPSSGRTPRQIL